MKRFLDNKDNVGEEMWQLMAELYPICRSITGAGVRDTLKKIGEIIPLKIAEVPTGTKVFDWIIPREWNIKDAYIKNSRGETILDFNDSNLHVLNYSVPVNKIVSLEELRPHLYTIPEHPDWIPYHTSYYDEKWGFCLSHKQFVALEDDDYAVFIDSSLKDGHLNFGECIIRGETQEEILISCHICHPSLCNDNLSGLVLSTFLAKHLKQIPLRFTYRFLFIPATIGSITWLSLNESNISLIQHGLVAVNLGDSGKFTYKKSRKGNTEIDQAVMNVLKNSVVDSQIIDFFPYGYDERQYCSPGFDLPVGCLMRTPHGRYPEYHTSADNLEFVKPQYLAESFSIYSSVLYVLENNGTYVSCNQKCEPQLGKRGVYQQIAGHSDSQTRQLAMFWVLNLSDGDHTLLDISNRSGLDFSLIKDTADMLVKCDLLTEPVK